MNSFFLLITLDILMGQLLQSNYTDLTQPGQDRILGRDESDTSSERAPCTVN